jgi:hypothetical protein
MTSAFLLVEIGRVPDYLWTNLEHLRNLNPHSCIILATDQAIAGHPKVRSLGIEVFHLDTQNLADQYPIAEPFSTRYRKRFWYLTSLRFLALRESIRELGIGNCIHVESDYLLYVTEDALVSRVPDDCILALNCERPYVIPGMIFIRGEEGASLACSCVYEGLVKGLADFDSLQSLVDSERPGVYVFPTLGWLNNAAIRRRPTIDLEGAILDAAALGHAILGTDRRPFRSNVETYTDLGEDDLVYFKNPARCDQPLLRKGGRLYPIWGLHTHAKRLECLATFYGSLDPISGCKCLEWADQVICLSQGFAYASRVGIERDRIILLNEESSLPPAGSILAVSGDEIYALPTNWMMKVRALGGLVFLVVNSDRDHDATELHRTFGERNVLFAQNLLPSPIEHRNIRPLPIGVQNRIWPEVNVHSVMTSRARKVFGILSSLASTHRSRIPAVFWSLVMATRLPHLEKPLEIRVHKWMGMLRGLYRSLRTGHVHGYRMPLNRWRTLLRGSFFVLSLRGNGADTHRFWEGQYHGAIPLLRPEDDLPAYSGWPRLVRSLRPIFLRGVRQQDITDAMARRDVRLIKGANEYEQEIRAAARALGEIYPR